MIPSKPFTVSLIISTREVGGTVGILVAPAHIGIDEQAEMRIVDLHDLDAHVLQQCDLGAQRGHAVPHEILTLRIGLARAALVPQPLAQQRRAPGSVILVATLAISFTNFASAATKPAAFGVSFSVTTVPGPPRPPD